MLLTGDAVVQLAARARPAEVLEYVVVHELLHVQEPNHSAAFWRLLDLHRPGWRDQAGWLRVHGRELLDYRIAAAG